MHMPLRANRLFHKTWFAVGQATDPKIAEQDKLVHAIPTHLGSVVELPRAKIPAHSDLRLANPVIRVESGAGAE